MTLVLPERERLATPIETESVAPLSFLTAYSTTLKVALDVPQPPSPPSHLVMARRLADEHPGSSVAAVRLAQAEQAVGEIRRAIDAAQRAVSLTRSHPDDAVTVAAIQVLGSSGAIDDAEAALQTVSDDAVKSILAARLAVHRGEHRKALSILTELDGIDALSLRGWLHLELHEWPQAIAAFRRAVRESVPTPGALTNLGFAYAALGSMKKAIRATKQAQALDPGNRLITFNLVSYYRAVGDFGAACHELRLLQELYPNDLQIRFAEADLRLANEDIQGAQGVLRRARTSSLWALADDTERAELTSNLLFLEWRMRRKSRSEVQAAVVRELENSAYRSEQIAAMLPALMTRVEDAATLERVLSSLAEVNTDVDAFDYLRVHLATLRCDFESATALAVERSRRQIFDPVAAAQAIFLLTDVRGDYETAASLGRDALRRFPSSAELRNNLAYALALAGHLQEARTILPPSTEGSVFLSATRALVDLLSGDARSGVEGYGRAHAIAQQNQDQTLAKLVSLNMLLAFHRYVQETGIEIGVPPLELPEDWESDPRFVLVARMARRADAPIIYPGSLRS